MAEPTKITDDQLRFLSSKTGEHDLGAYLEDAEKGGRALGDLISDIFNAAGDVNADFVQWRVNPTTRAIQTRNGQHIDPEANWVDTGDYYYRHRGIWAPATTYKQTDTITKDGLAYFAKEAHASGGVFDATKWIAIIDATAFAAITDPIVNAAQLSADNAAASEVAAAASAAEVAALNFPAPVADTFLRRNGANTAFEAKTAIDIAQEVATASPLPATTGSVTLDLAAASNFEGALTGDITLEDPLNMAQGQSGAIVLTQGATPYEAVFGTKWKFAAGFVPTLTAEVGAVDVIAYYVESATRISAIFHGDVK